jgi:endonuclease-3 related protein
VTAEQLRQIYDLAFDYFGPQHWWPGQTQFEIIVGAILTQNTNWANVEKAITNIKEAELLAPQALHEPDINQLAELIRPAGYFNVKAKRLKSFLDWLFEQYDGRLENLEQLEMPRFRDELLSIKGIGPETADSILLYAFGRPVFVVDAYTARIIARHSLIEPPFDYEQLQQLFELNLESDVQFFNEYHALLVQVGKQFCKPKAKCAGCPLEKLPHSLEYEA